jgi:thymidylate synthase (FAD)
VKYLTEPEVTLIDKMGSDLTVVNAARVSFDKESVFDWGVDGEAILSSGDKKLINYLAKHNHWAPFGHITAQFRIKAPVYVARQLVKHQVGLVWNEVSRRYVDSEPEYFKPVWRTRPAESIKQGSGGVFEGQELQYVEWQFEEVMSVADLAYHELLREGVAPEQARMVLPLNHATEWYWTGSVAAFARVCRLRLDPHAQKETADVAAKIDAALNDAFPVSWAALMQNN